MVLNHVVLTEEVGVLGRKLPEKALWGRWK